MPRTKVNFPQKGEKRYVVCPWCGEKVLYLRRRGHSCFKYHLSEIERNIHQMGRG
jgi:DNA-directed RNA polymerase subunit RPC12/RpoP